MGLSRPVVLAVCSLAFCLLGTLREFAPSKNSLPIRSMNMSLPDEHQQQHSAESAPSGPSRVRRPPRS